jgi:hypothetical protein
LTGVFTVSADLQFYPATGRDDSRAPDLVAPLVQKTSSGINLPAFLFSPSDQLTTTFTLPPNIERAYLDVIAQSQSTDEQWFACFPNDLNAINQLYGCGNTDFRETEVTIDGQPAGIAPVSPWVYTGFLPDQWRPIPAVQTLDFVPYRVNLTPFAGLLSDGKPHTIALSVFNNDHRGEREPQLYHCWVCQHFPWQGHHLGFAAAEFFQQPEYRLRHCEFHGAESEHRGRDQCAFINEGVE